MGVFILLALTLVYRSQTAAYSAYLAFAAYPVYPAYLGVPRRAPAYLAYSVNPAHPVQRAVAEATAELSGENLAGHAVDGCSAPNFAVSLTGLARAAAKFAAAETVLSGVRRDAAIRLRQAMATHPFEVAGAGRCCTELMQAAGGRIAIKTGAEGAFLAILPESGLGVALKIDDGNTVAAECAMTGVLVALGALDPSDPRVEARLEPTEVNRRGVVCGGGAPAEAITGLKLG